MCGRYTLTVPNPDTVQAAFQLAETPTAVPPRYNIAPTQPVPVVTLDAENRRKMGQMLWGLIPSWSKDRSIASKLINARGESVHEKPSFRTAFKRRRCLVIADGFYEWRKDDDGGKTPMFIHMADGGLFGFAGLWERWTDPESGDSLNTCTLITTEPNDLMRSIHNRMPVILPPEHYDAWLTREENDTGFLLSLLKPYPAEPMTAHPVSRAVNNPRHDDPALIQPIQ